MPRAVPQEMGMRPVWDNVSFNDTKVRIEE